MIENKEEGAQELVKHFIFILGSLQIEQAFVEHVITKANLYIHNQSIETLCEIVDLQHNITDRINKSMDDLHTIYNKIDENKESDTAEVS